ncbi:MAG: tungsten formylmethanofuran dehydrogenase [Phyllobacterium sp.]
MHGTRSAIALTERLGGAYDHARGQTLAREVALFTDHGGMFTTPGEVRRRSSLIVFIGDISDRHRELLQEWATTQPDLGDRRKRVWFHISGDTADTGRKPARKPKLIPIGAKGLSLGAALAIFRAELRGGPTTASLSNMEHFRKALAVSRFPVFVFSGNSGETPDLVMLQGLVADLNRTQRASSLFLPADDDAWGTALTSLWMTGFPPRTGFINSLPSYDPGRWDIQRMIRDKEADVHVWMSTGGGETSPRGGKIAVISLCRTEAPTPGASVTISVGKAGLDHDGVRWSSRTGTFRSMQATQPSQLPSIPLILGKLAQALPGRKALPC